MALRPASCIPGVDDRPTRSRRCPAIAHGAPSRESALNLSSPARAQKFVDRHHPASSVRPLQLPPPNWSMMTRPPWVDWTEYVAAQDTSDSVDDITVGHIYADCDRPSGHPEGSFSFEKPSRPGDGHLANHGSLQSADAPQRPQIILHFRSSILSPQRGHSPGGSVPASLRGAKKNFAIDPRLHSVMPEWSDQEFLRTVFDETRVVRTPLRGIIAGYHVLPYVLLGPAEYDRTSKTVEVRGRIRVSPRLVL